LAIYRSAAPVDAAIHQGVRLLWLVTGIGGLVMYAALYRLFLAVHRGRLEIRSKFAAFSAEHGRLIQLEKLSAMGQMVTEIAHQLNNPLVGVVNLTELAERESDPARVKQLLGQVRTAGERCREYVERILRLGKLNRPERQPTDLGQLVRDTATFFEQSLGGHPRLELDLPDQPVTCEVDPVLMRNALFNLVHNATQADRNGPIEVSLTGEERGGTPGYSLTVADHGPGFSPDAIDKLFTPFFTTRPGGTGLGLSIAQHIAILHGGTIAATNPRGGGARVAIWIPATGALGDREDPAGRG
jgi:signal transduction histidine kinase